MKDAVEERGWAGVGGEAGVEEGRLESKTPVRRPRYREEKSTGQESR